MISRCRTNYVELVIIDESERLSMAALEYLRDLFDRQGIGLILIGRRWRQLGLELDDADFTDAQAVSAIVRITGSNFRLVHRLFVQIERILRINGLTAVTDDVVQAARSVLVIGAT